MGWAGTVGLAADIDVIKLAQRWVYNGG